MGGNQNGLALNYALHRLLLEKIEFKGIALCHLSWFLEFSRLETLRTNVLVDAVWLLGPGDDEIRLVVHAFEALTNTHVSHGQLLGLGFYRGQSLVVVKVWQLVAITVLRGRGLPFLAFLLQI